MTYKILFKTLKQNYFAQSIKTLTSIKYYKDDIRTSSVTCTSINQILKCGYINKNYNCIHLNTINTHILKYTDILKFLLAVTSSRR